MASISKRGERYSALIRRGNQLGVMVIRERGSNGRLANSGLVIAQDMLLAKPIVRHEKIRSDIFKPDADSP